MNMQKAFAVCFLAVLAANMALVMGPSFPRAEAAVSVTGIETNWFIVQNQFFKMEFDYRYNAYLYIFYKPRSESYRALTFTGWNAYVQVDGENDDESSKTYSISITINTASRVRVKEQWHWNDNFNMTTEWTLDDSSELINMTNWCTNTNAVAKEVGAIRTCNTYASSSNSTWNRDSWDNVWYNGFWGGKLNGADWGYGSPWLSYRGNSAATPDYSLYRTPWEVFYSSDKDLAMYFIYSPYSSTGTTWGLLDTWQNWTDPGPTDIYSEGTESFFQTGPDPEGLYVTSGYVHTIYTAQHRYFLDASSGYKDSYPRIGFNDDSSHPYSQFLGFVEPDTDEERDSYLIPAQFFYDIYDECVSGSKSFDNKGPFAAATDQVVTETNIGNLTDLGALWVLVKPGIYAGSFETQDYSLFHKHGLKVLVYMDPMRVIDVDQAVYWGWADMDYNFINKTFNHNALYKNSAGNLVSDEKEIMYYANPNYLDDNIIDLIDSIDSSYIDGYYMDYACTNWHRDYNHSIGEMDEYPWEFAVWMSTKNLYDHVHGLGKEFWVNGLAQPSVYVDKQGFDRWKDDEIGAWKLIAGDRPFFFESIPRHYWNNDGSYHVAVRHCILYGAMSLMPFWAENTGDAIPIKELYKNTRDLLVNMAWSKMWRKPVVRQGLSFSSEIQWYSFTDSRTSPTIWYFTAKYVGWGGITANSGGTTVDMTLQRTDLGITDSRVYMVVDWNGTGPENPKTQFWWRNNEAAFHGSSYDFYAHGDDLNSYTSQRIFKCDTYLKIVKYTGTTDYSTISDNSIVSMGDPVFTWMTQMNLYPMWLRSSTAPTIDTAHVTTDTTYTEMTTTLDARRTGYDTSSQKLSLAFQEASGAYTQDATSNENTASITGADWTSSGRVGYALDFETDNSDYVNVPDDSTLDGYSTGMSISFWVKFESVAKRMQIIGKYDSSGNQRSYMVDWDDDPAQLGFFYSSDGTNYKQTTYSWTPTVDTWYHIAITWSASTTPEIFLDGTEVSVSSTGTTTSIYASAEDLMIGKCAYDATRYFDGVIDEVKLWSRHITDTEIGDLAARRFDQAVNSKVRIWSQFGISNVGSKSTLISLTDEGSHVYLITANPHYDDEVLAIYNDKT